MTMRCILCGHTIERDLVSHVAREYAREMGNAPTVIAAVCRDGAACIARAQARRGSQDVDG